MRGHTARGPVVLAAIGLIAMLAGGAAGADPLTLLAQERGIFARAQASASGEFGQEIDPAEAVDFDFFEAATDAQAATSASSASAAASLLGGLDAEALGAAGAVSSAAAAGSTDGYAVAPADAFFEILFRSDVAQTFALMGELAAGANGAVSDGYVRVALVDDATGAALVSHAAGPGEGASFAETGLLAAGVPYRLTAWALSGASAAGSPPGGAGDASFEVVLGVPEPRRDLLLAAGAALLLLLRRLRGGLR